MKKQLLISSLILFLAHNFIYAIEIDENYLSPLDDSTETIEKKRKNAIEIELFGKGIFYSINYIRKITISKEWNLKGLIGFSEIGFRKSMPLELVLGYTKKKMQIEIGGGISLFYSPNGTNLSREDYWAENPDFLNRGRPTIYGGIYIPKTGFEYYFTTGLKYNVNDKYYIGINYYYAHFFNSYNLENYLIKNYGGIKFGLLF
jgi:hypothetical protein